MKILEEENINSTVQQIFSDHLEANGHRKTSERFTILEEIYSCSDHFDVESLYGLMKTKNYRVSRATLYNTIDLLLACRLIRKHQFGQNMAQFEKSYSNKQHDHLICTQCDKVMEFCDPRIQNIKNTIGELMSFQIDQHSLNLYGRCSACSTSK